ncbi:MAG TPA: hypothetical protein VF414_06255, partial [Thermoanaerobaculia bacterium]
GISGLTGNVQTTLTSGLGSTYTDARATKTAAGETASEITDTLTRAYTPSVGATFSKNPTFTLAVLDTQEFMRGFLKPLGKDVLNYYWTQGWPPELLLYLLVQRVEIQEEGQPLKILRNYPDSADPDVADMKEFARWVQTEFLAKDPQIVVLPNPVAIGPELPASEVTNLERLISVAKEGLSITKVDLQGERYQLQKEQTDIRFRLADEPAPAVESADKREYNRNVAQENQKVAVTQVGTKTVTFVLRSPEALIYYLGELARLENRKPDPLTPYVCIQGQYQPLFVALPEGTCADTLVDADTGRERYSIPPTTLANATDKCERGSLTLRKPECEGGRSMQALRLLNQIISLQKSAQDNPSTALVRVID